VRGLTIGRGEKGRTSPLEGREGLKKDKDGGTFYWRKDDERRAKGAREYLVKRKEAGGKWRVDRMSFV